MTDLLRNWLVDVVLPGVGSAVLAAAFALAWKWLERIEDERVREVVRELVRAAEQIFGRHNGERKLAYVQEGLAARKLKVDPATIEAMVNSEFPHFGVMPDADGFVPGEAG